MSCERKVKTFETVTIKIDACNKKELEEIETCIISSINQKLEKLNILFKSCDVYSNGRCLLVHDRFNICSSLKEVAEAFGLSCELVDCSLRGKTYLITDQLLHFLDQIDVNFAFGSTVCNKELNEEIKKIMFGVNDVNIDPEVLRMVRVIKEHGAYVTKVTKEITQVYYDDKFLRKEEISRTAEDVVAIQKRLLAMSKDAEQIIQKTNEYLRDGTVKLIHTRARQMGYAVKEVKKGTQTQLVLVRYE